MSDELCQPFALLPRRSDPRIRIAKPGQRSVEKLVGRRRSGTLSIEGPTKNELGRAIAFGSHLPEPIVEQRRLPDTGPGNDCDDIYVWIRPGSVKESDILLATKKLSSCN